MLNFYVMPGDTIEYVVGRMIDIARIDNQSVTTSFNDIEVTVDASSNAIDIVNKFMDDINERHKAWLNSVDGIRALCAAEERRRNLQHRCDVLLAKLDTLDFSDDASILSWLCELADCDHFDVDSKSREVLAKFKHEGYHADVNCGEHFNGEDRENFMRYIVGQALSGIAAVGSPHGVIHKFVEEWRQKFLVQ